MKLWKDFFDDLLPLVPACPPNMATFHLRRAAQDWCERTLCWREWLDDVTTQAGVDTYDLDIASTEEVVQLLRATMDGRAIEVLRQDNLPKNWRNHQCERGIFTPDRISFVIVPAPDASVIVQTEVAMKPSNSATGVSDEIYRHYVYQIALGAAARLHAIPGKPYSAQSGARTEYEDAVARVASEVSSSNSRAPTRVRAHFL